MVRLDAGPCHLLVVAHLGEALLAQRPQVEVVLQHLPQQLTPTRLDG